MWNKNAETMEPKQLKILQGERLKALVEKLYERVPFYRKKFDEQKVLPKDINSIEDISRLPFTTKDELRTTYPFGLLAVHRDDIVELHTSSGTTGIPVVDAYTHDDIDTWSEAMARTLAAGGTQKSDIVQNAYGYGLFTGGLGVHYGSRKIGAFVIPISGGNTKRQLQVMKDFGVTVLTCTPSYSLYLAEGAREAGVDFSSMKLRRGFFGAEPWSDKMRKDIEKKLNIRAYDIYGLTEIIGPGVSGECEEQRGLHVWEDLFYPEIINPVTGEVLPDGQKGELVITTLTKEGTPLIRYRTRDITYLMPDACRCGRTLRRMHRLLGRTDDMLIVRGVNVFPSQVEEVLLKIEHIEPHYLLIVDRKNAMDVLEVQVEMNETLFSDEIKNLEAIERQIEHELQSALNIHAKVKLVEPKTIPRSEGKAKRVIDKREI